MVMVLAAPARSEEPAALKTQKDKVNYGIGLNVIGNLKAEGIDIDLDMVMRGMKDGLAGGKTLLSDDELVKTMTQLQSEIRLRRAQAMKPLAEQNKKAGEAFLAENGKMEGVVTLPSGLQYKVMKAGTGPKPTIEDTIECKYKGTLINGTEFDNSERHGSTATLKVAALIPGWVEALKLMPVGSTWQLFVPSGLAYGERGGGREVGPNATLIFTIELIGIKKK